MTVLTLVAVAFGVTRTASERAVTRSYLDVVFEVVTEESAMAEGFTDMIATIETFSRARMVQTMNDLEALGVAGFDRLIEAEVPESLVAADLYLRIAISSWRAGLSEVKSGLVLLSANPVDEEGLAGLQRGFIDLRVGDRAYRGFLSEVADLDTSLHGEPLPTLVFIPTGEEAAYDPREIARRMLLAPDLGVVIDLAVADIRLDPPPLGVQGGLPVVPATETLNAEATVSNRGNLDQIAINVTLRLRSSTGALHEQTRIIEVLEAGRATTVTFAPLPVEPGINYEITISVPGGDAQPENDTVSMIFVVNVAG
ncbi:MAG: hypothetical protein WEA29_01075 [Acidimicrobiia bacterium]